MSPANPARAIDPQIPDHPASASKALRFFGGHSVEDTLRQARLELASAERCRCCSSLLQHIHDRLGSTLFLDDDPEQLAQAFDAADRDRLTPRILAAYVLLTGRPREDVFTHR